MTSTMTSTETTAEQVVRKHPVRGAIWGLLLGLGLAIYSILFAIIPWTDWLPLILVVLAGVVIGVAWAYLAPAKKPGPPPAAPPAPAAPEPVAEAPVDETPSAGGDVDAVAEEDPVPTEDLGSGGGAGDADVGDLDPGSSDDPR